MKRQTKQTPTQIILTQGVNATTHAKAEKKKKKKKRHAEVKNWDHCEWSIMQVSLSRLFLDHYPASTGYQN